MVDDLISLLEVATLTPPPAESSPTPEPGTTAEDINLATDELPAFSPYDTYREGPKAESSSEAELIPATQQVTVAFDATRFTQDREVVESQKIDLQTNTVTEEPPETVAFESRPIDMPTVALEEPIIPIDDLVTEIDDVEHGTSPAGPHPEFDLQLPGSQQQEETLAHKLLQVERDMASLVSSRKVSVPDPAEVAEFELKFERVDEQSAAHSTAAEPTIAIQGGVTIPEQPPTVAFESGEHETQDTIPPPADIDYSAAGLELGSQSGPLFSSFEAEAKVYSGVEFSLEEPGPPASDLKEAEPVSEPPPEIAPSQIDDPFLNTYAEEMLALERESEGDAGSSKAEVPAEALELDTQLFDPKPLILDTVKDQPYQTVVDAPTVEPPPVGYRSIDTQPETKSASKLPYIAAGIGAFLLTLIVVGFATYFLLIRQDTEQQPTQDAKAIPAAPAEQAPAPPAKIPDHMVYVPGGKFVMGRDDGISEERPSHAATVEPFLIDKYEVTNEEYAKFVSATNHKAPRGWRNKNFLKGQDKLPVVGVDWYDATEYAEWAGKRLPTEEEWEFAARGPASLLYPWGNVWVGANANIASRKLAEVGQFPGQSPFGVYDMVGNAGEWTSNDFKPYKGGELDSRYDGKRDLKTRRGSDFTNSQRVATNAFRFGLPATGEKYEVTGFRCAKSVNK